ncbi:MAG TPA: hypothetical protein VLE49_08355, partial [Anaerolineales bacterium]|nr:hypothetical protein [Anaerolineales bacterium]
FFQSLDNVYTQLTPAADQVVIQADCWGWLGGALKYLGQGKTIFDIKQPPSQVVIGAAGFQFVGTPQIPTGYGGGPTLDVPAPYALREPMNASDCTAHSHPLLAPFICNTLLNAPIKENVILEWEWAKPACWPGYCGWTDSIDGYRIYEFNTATKAEKYLKEITNPSQKITAIPLPWGAPCYGVRAYVNTPAFLESDITTYCPGQSPAPQQVILAPTNWLTTGGQWIQDGDCDTYGLADQYVYDNNKSGFGNQPGEILVGSYIVDDEDADCFRQGDYSGAVKFETPVLPPNAVIQKAVLKFSDIQTDYGASGLATNFKLFCASSVGTAKQDWTGLGSAIHFWGDDVLHAYNSPLTSLSGWNHTPEVNVTPVVNKWIKGQAQNNGFILTSAEAPSPLVDGHGECLSQAGNFQLEIYYFAP